MEHLEQARWSSWGPSRRRPFIYLFFLCTTKIPSSPGPTCERARHCRHEDSGYCTVISRNVCMKMVISLLLVLLYVPRYGVVTNRKSTWRRSPLLPFGM